MWVKLAAETLGALDGARTETDAFDTLVAYAKGLGADLVSYHHIAPPFSSRHENFSLLSKGFPEDWVRQYREQKLHRVDPITSFAAYQTRPVLWSQVPDRVRLTDEQHNYMTLLNSWLSPGDGLAIPAFGPSGRHGYVGIGRRTPIDHWTPPQVRMVQAVCESFHLRFCELRLAGLDKDFELTERELRILTGMAKGWTDPMIGAQVGLRPDAVRAAMRQILEKMAVSDRPSAVLRAKALGLVEA